MKIRKISVFTAMKLPHPAADFASVSGGVTIEAELAAGESESTAIKKLQVTADNLVEQHMESLTARFRLKADAIKPQKATEAGAAKLADKYAPF